ncbi:dTDP-glucose pyrophosphorylase [Azospirillum fermentarium]|uniref:glycosyltransferase family 2 protein n=1 Tax=Azospirillum fermentarium TaxID=1233114 RepID=UPI0022263104|nr:glycosyltransferase family 2 protein [Azospirillum fermentarium]MCW2249613.1 dTDP-glucose pyrophosphorylase [Azospirillum fermentarium]
MINILVLLAGSSTPFREAGYSYPKSLIEIAGLPAVERVLAAYRPLEALGARFIFVVRGDENRRFHIGMVLRLLMPDAMVVETPGETAGAACTALLAVAEIDNGSPLIIANGDQIIDHDLRNVVADFQNRGLDGGILVFKAVHPRWSYVKCDDDGLLIEAAEKRPISDLATAGFYWFARGRDFVRAAERMILKDAHVDNAFFICPAYNEMILDQKRVGVHLMTRDAYHSLATPALMQRYEEQVLSGRCVERQP